MVIIISFKNYKYILSFFSFEVDGNIYNLSSCEQDFQLQSTSTEIAALKIACVLLEQGKLKQYSEEPYREITVKTPNETVVYEAWKEFDEQQDKYFPKIQTKRTTFNMGWFENNTGLSDIATSLVYQRKDVIMLLM